MTSKVGASGSKKGDDSNDWGDDENWEDWGDALDHTQVENNEIESTDRKLDAKTALTVDRDSSCINNVSEDNGEKRQKAEEPQQSPVPATEKSGSSPSQDQHREATKQSSVTTDKTSSWGSSWGWSGVVSSVLSSATEGIGNITTTVSKGLDQVIGVPDPEDLARLNATNATEVQDVKANTESKENEAKTTNEKQDQTSTVPVLGFVTTLGSKVINTGLDTLEGIGKKTMDILQENDPGLKNKRKMLGLQSDKPNLSEILQEAKKNADQLEDKLNELRIEKSKENLRFDVLFENECGLVHYEALEILSRESALKIQTLLGSVSGNALTELKETLTEVRELMELDDIEGDSEGDYDASELKEKLATAVSDIGLQIQFDVISSKWQEAINWIVAVSPETPNQDLFAKGITVLAETCALEMNKLHKIAELLLVKDHHSTASEVDGIIQLCKEFVTHLNGLTNRFATAFNIKDSDETKSQISTFFSEMLRASSHIEKAQKLFLPIIQIGAV